jgi:quercetin dioxygenase-like cupin family protein
MSTENSKTDLRQESIHSGAGEETSADPGVSFREFVGAACNARGFSTGTATFQPGSVLAYHKHSFCETLTILDGVAEVKVEGRCYRLQQFDCICLPAGVAHEVKSASHESPTVLLWACASPLPSQEEVRQNFYVQDRGLANPGKDDPESIVRFAEAEEYELSPGAEFRDVFAGRFGSVGICGAFRPVLTDPLQSGTAGNRVDYATSARLFFPHRFRNRGGARVAYDGAKFR